MSKNVKGPVTALWPIMWCLGFAEAAIGAIAYSNTVPGWFLCVAAILMLGMVLGVYLVMYTRYPGFLTVSGREAVELAKFRMLIENTESIDKFDKQVLMSVIQTTTLPDPQDIQMTSDN